MLAIPTVKHVQIPPPSTAQNATNPPAYPSSKNPPASPSAQKIIIIPILRINYAKNAIPPACNAAAV